MRTHTRITFSLVASAAVVLGIAAPAVAISPTEPVADIAPGTANSNPQDLTVFDGKLYFSANDGSGAELFVSDGSVGSAVNLNLNSTGASNPTNFTILGTSMYFSASNGVNGTELWVVNGSAAPMMVRDLEAGSGSSSPTDITLFDGDVYFRASTSVQGQTLWKLTGSTASQYPMGGLQVPNNFFEYNGYLYFSAVGPSNDQLYRLDGTNPPTLVAILNPTGIGYPHAFAEAGGALYFLASDGATAPSYNYELWTTDGTTTTKLTTDFANADGYQSFIVFNDILYFSAGPSAMGDELGHTTGGAVPTYYDINPGAASSDSSAFTELAGSLYFAANNGANGYELYSLTGSGSPVLRADIVPGAGSSYPYDFEVAGTRLAFAATTNDTDWELWSFDGTTANQETALNPTNDANVYFITQLGDYTYFAAAAPGTGRELYRTLISPTVAPALATTGADALVPASIAALLLLAGFALALTRRRVLETQE